MAPYSATTKACQAMASTVAGQRRILKRQESVVQYIRKAVESGVYRTADELALVRKERATGTDDLRVIMQRFRQDIVRGSYIHDYPTEYLILEQHPPIPDPPRTPIKFLRQLQPPPNPVERLTKKYLQRQEQQHNPSSPQRNSNSDHGSSSAPTSSEEYYRRLLGVQAASSSSSSLAFAADSSLRQKPARVQRAYAAAIAHYQLQRSEADLSDAQAMHRVDEMLAQQVRSEHAAASRARTTVVAKHRDNAVVATKQTVTRDTTATSTSTGTATTSDGAMYPFLPPGFHDIGATHSSTQATSSNDGGSGSGSTSSSGTSTWDSIFSDNPRTVQAMMNGGI
jgi:hypothetical protein